ncbi:MAG: hypothetical protein K0R57_3279 [Paenibacillaceae bacterium]|jgi:hypothetical protein|nr:hypothetical protein [Paenibacillaceae bacterium]
MQKPQQHHEIEAPGHEQGSQVSYEELFAGFSDSVERLLIRTAQVLAVLLVAVQLILLVPAARQQLVKVERLEGVPFHNR